MRDSLRLALGKKVRPYLKNNYSIKVLGSEFKLQHCKKLKKDAGEININNLFYLIHNTPGDMIS
jgi:hypothetical protein